MAAIVFSLSLFAARAEQNENPQEFGKLQIAVTERLQKLGALIDKAEKQNVDTTYARVSVETIKAFQNAAEWDHSNPEEVLKVFKTFYYYDKIDPIHTERVAYHELRDCLKVADFAARELSAQMEKRLTLPATPDFSKGSLKLAPYSYELDGRQVFPYTLFWLPTENAGMAEAFGRMGHTYMDLSFLDAEGKINPWTVKSRADSAHIQSKNNFMPLKFFWSHNAPSWLEEEHPELLQGGRMFTQYDIDDPQIRQWQVDLCRQYIPPMAKAFGEKPMVYMIANEPHFATAQKGWLVKNGLSQNTLDRYRRWLKTKYGTIERLNATHGTTYASFPVVPMPFPISQELRGKPVWYDWCRFNMDRVNDWFTHLKNSIQSFDGGRKEPVTIKVLGHHFSDHARDQGIDIEYLVNLQDVTGGDLRVRPFDAEVYAELEGGMKARTSWKKRYAYEWISQTLFLDFNKSLAPEKVFYDTEWHGFGAVHWRRFGLSREYVRAGVWHAFTNGMGAIEPWMWGRNPDGSFRHSADQIGELATQPVALDAYGRVMKELNAYAELITAAVAKPRNFMFYYLEESAIQDAEYAHHLEDSYEAVKLLNHTVGMTTPTHLTTLDPLKQVVIVPPSEFIADDSLAALQSFQKKGGRIVVLDPGRSFLRNEHGFPRKSPELDHIGLTLKPDVFEMADDFRKVLAPYTWKEAFQVTFKNPAGKDAYGVLMQSVVDPASGSLHLILNNSAHGVKNVMVEIDGEKPPLIDLLTGERLQSPFPMNSCDVRLIRVGH
ncbi:beta-galactosidase [Luteolibacter algae]|uniref:Beta-galactosidase n=1 Tax=Luteolibacter algae TaxID=454151 RepID=A0ABW5D7E4_9BACT